MADAPVVPASSILGRFAQAVGDAVDGHNTKILPVGVIEGIFAEYKALDDDDADEIRAAAKRRAKKLSKTQRDGGGGDPEGERMAYAQLLARACVQLMVEAPEGSDEKYEPLHEAVRREEGIDMPPLAYNRDLVEFLASAGELPAGLDAESSAVQIVAALHRNGQSSAPLVTMGSAYDAWRAGVTAAVIDAVG